ncbi:PilW family protein [Patescibacteria group bacterium]
MIKNFKKQKGFTPLDNKHLTGFTLAELMIVLGITLLVFILLINTYILSQRAYIKSSNRYEIVQNSRVFIDRISRELRQSPELVTILPETIAGAPFEIIFQDGHNGTIIKYIKYYLINSDLYRQISHYSFPENPTIFVQWNSENGFGESPVETIETDEIIGEYVDSLIFYGINNLINIEAVFSKHGENINIYTQVAGRNL